MSNPFDDAGGRQRQYARPQQQAGGYTRHSNSRGGGYSSSAVYSGTAMDANPQQHQQQYPTAQSTHPQQQSSQQPSQPPIFSARGVEWPLPAALSASHYRKWRRESKSLGSSLGIGGSGLRLPHFGGPQSGGAGGSGDRDGRNAGDTAGGGTGGGGAGGGEHGSVGGSMESNAAGTSSSSGTANAAGGGYGGLTGLMGRVLGASSPAGAGAGMAALTNDIEEEDLNISATRPVLPPNARCVAAANGWIVAVVECGHAPSVGTNASGASSTAMLQTKHGLTALLPPLRLVSRWNVRRGTSPGSEGSLLVPLPPPVRPAMGTEDGATSAGMVAGDADPTFGRIAHTFVDPTGCHVLLSARNGEAYYLHSTSKKAQKLDGFGPAADGTYAGYKAGVALGEGPQGGDAMAGVQTGLTPGSYVTAVGWDRDRGTEGSTKRIVLGTSLGELYEYSLVSPNATAASSGKSKASPFDAKAGELGAATDEYGDSDPLDGPVLLRRLNGSARGTGRGTSGAAEGGAVGGVLFQRITGGGASASNGCVVVLASTGGLHPHTRLHTFRSEPAASGDASSSMALRSAFLRRSDPTFVELPGSVECAELCSCKDGFALRTETGIYYGAIETMASAIAMGNTGVAAAGGGSGGIMDAGMLTYDSLKQATSGSQRGAGIVPPSSIGLTPHHFIALSSSNEVRFVNCVAKKVIQEERVDWVSVSSQTSSAADGDLQGSSAWGGGVVAAELLMDVRRPDQIWLRRARSLVHISSTSEDRDVWKFTLARCIETAGPSAVHYPSSPGKSVMTSEEKHVEGQFEHAMSLCTSSSQRAVVNAVRAEYHLSQGRAELAAKYMAQCPSSIMPFADTAIRLALPMLGGGRSNDSSSLASCRDNTPKANEALANSNMALIVYLSDKMRASKSRNNSMECTMLGSWLTELHLQERDREGSRHAPPVNHALLHQFLSAFVRDMDPKTILNVLASHDISAGECAGYSAAAGDIGAAVNAALSGEDEKNGALDALRVLNDAPIERAEPYYYNHALTLLSRAPMSAAKSFVARYTEGLSDTKLLPSFMHYERKRKNNANPAAAMDSGASNAPAATFVDDENASIRFLEGVIKLGSKSRAVYNYLTSLYASMEDEGPLFRFLSTHVPPAPSSASAIGTTGSDVSHLLLKQANEEQSCPLDKAYALRTILRTGRHFRSAVKLYMGFGMRQQAVELALKVDPALARELARQSDDNEETKRLWLMIARNAAANGGSSSRDGKDVVARVVMVLKDCGPEILSIEDVLPFLPDFAQIDQFKDEICDALASYSSKIEHYLKEMNECDQACDALRDELSRLKTEGTQVRADARCAFTNKLVLEAGEPFYAFPSGYVVLESALKREVLPHLNEKQLGRVAFIENELAILRKSRAGGAGRNSHEAARDEYELEELQVELDGLIAAECPLTGSVMVESIDRGFIGDEDDDFASL